MSKDIGKSGFELLTKELFESLKTRETRELKLRFGIDLGNLPDSDETAKRIDATRRRIHEIEDKALRVIGLK